MSENIWDKADLLEIKKTVNRLSDRHTSDLNELDSLETYIDAQLKDLDSVFRQCESVEDFQRKLDEYKRGVKDCREKIESSKSDFVSQMYRDHLFHEGDTMYESRDTMVDSNTRNKQEISVLKDIISKLDESIVERMKNKTPEEIANDEKLQQDMRERKSENYKLAFCEDLDTLFEQAYELVDKSVGVVGRSSFIPEAETDDDRVSVILNGSMYAFSSWLKDANVSVKTELMDAFDKFYDYRDAYLEQVANTDAGNESVLRDQTQMDRALEANILREGLSQEAKDLCEGMMIKGLC